MLIPPQLPFPAVVRPYVGRFAPSPTGALHAGSLVAALASYLDAQAHQGQWLVRIEDVDQTRTVPGAAESMVAQLQAFGMEADGEIVWQSRRDDLYAVAFDKLQEHVFACGCTRSEIADSISGSVAGSVTDAAGMATAAAIY
ncbi:MAG: hypothetical protein H7327_10250, partial [Herminiimonas sp.]|nr:hypothetical protein [Herminiimonas sp.]